MKISYSSIFPWVSYLLVFLGGFLFIYSAGFEVFSGRSFDFYLAIIGCLYTAIGFFALFKGVRWAQVGSFVLIGVSVFSLLSRLLNYLNSQI